MSRASNAETEPASTTTIDREFHMSMTREKKENLQESSLAGGLHSVNGWPRVTDERRRVK